MAGVGGEHKSNEQRAHREAESGVTPTSKRSSFMLNSMTPSVLPTTTQPLSPIKGQSATECTRAPAASGPCACFARPLSAFDPT